MLMGTEVDSICDAPYRQSTKDRENHRNGYRERDTRVGTIDPAIDLPRVVGLPLKLV